MIGKLRHKAAIETFNETSKSDRGHPIGQWVSLYEFVPMQIETLNGRELEDARQIVPTATHKVTMRYHPDITTKERINFNEVIFNIEHIDNIDFRNLWLEMLAHTRGCPT